MSTMMQRCLVADSGLVGRPRAVAPCSRVARKAMNVQAVATPVNMQGVQRPDKQGRFGK